MPRISFFLLFLALPVLAHADGAPGGLLLMDLARQWGAEASARRTLDGMRLQCLKFEGRGSSTGATFVPFTCTDDPAKVHQSLQRKVDAIRSDKLHLNNAINKMAPVNPEIRYMKDRQDRTLKDSLEQWFSACQAASQLSKAVAAQGGAPQGGGCDPLGNATRTSRAGIQAKTRAVEVKQNARKSARELVEQAYQKDRRLVRGTANRARIVQGYGKDTQKEVESLYGPDGPFGTLLGGMDYELCQDMDVIQQLQEKAAETSAAQESCGSLTP